MGRFGLFLITVLFALSTNASATTTYLQCNGVDSNFTMVQGDTFSWHADCDTGADVWMEIWIDLNGNHQIDEGTDIAWQTGFTQTDGSSGSGGPGDMDGTANGEIYFEMELGLAPATWILRATDQTDMSSKTCWGTITPMMNPAFVVQGQVSGPGGFDPENRIVAYDSDNGIWQVLTDASGYYYLNLGAGFAEGDTVPLQCSDAAGYSSPAEMNVVLPAAGDTLYGIDWTYSNPAAWVYGAIVDDRGDTVTDGEIYVIMEPVSGGSWTVVQPDANGVYQFYFGDGDVGSEWQFQVHYQTFPANHMQPYGTSFTVNMSDSINYDFTALYTDTFFTGTVTENGGAPSGAYSLRYWCGSGGSAAMSDAGTGAYTMPISSTIDSGSQGSVAIDTNFRDGGTPLPMGYTVDGSWNKQALGGDVVDFDLVQAAVIAGRLMNAADSSGLGYFNQVELTDWFMSMHNQQQTDNDGYFVFDVSPGDYRIYTSSDQGFNGIWYNGEQNSEDADTLAVNGGDTLFVEIYLTQGSSISGMVMDSDSNIITGHGVEVRDAYTGNWAGQASADSTGAYYISNLTAGAYLVRAHDDNGYIGKYWPDGNSDWEADTVFLGTGDNQSGYDFYLSQGNSISGYVFSDDTTALYNMMVSIYDTNQSHRGQTTTDSSGYFRISGISDGAYAVRAEDGYGYIGEYWQEQDEIWNADFFALYGGNDTTGFDFYLMQGLNLSGMVLAESDSMPVSGLNVELNDAEGNYLAQATTDSTGSYAFGGLAAGFYKLQAMDANGFIGEWFNNAEWASTADTVDLQSDISGINFYLMQGFSISGYVYDDSDSTTPVYDLQVEAYDPTKMTAGSARTDSSGYYEITGLSADTYTLGIQGGSGYIGEYWQDQDQSWMADTFAVNGDVSGYDFYLVRGGSISGTVLAEGDSTGINNIRVSLYDSSWSHQGDQWTDSTGAFWFNGLVAGAYKISVESNYGYAGEWYSDKASFGDADAIILTQGEDAGGFFIYLGTGASISGYVYDDADSTPVQGMEVRLNDFNWMFSTSEYTDSTGYYIFSGLSPDNYRLSTDTRNGYSGEYYNDKSQESEADTIMLGSSDTTGFDMYIAKSAVISGYVLTEADSMPLDNVEVCINDGISYNNMTWTDSSGYYELSVPGGAYFVYVSNPPGNYLAEEYDNNPLWSNAGTLAVAGGDTLDSIDFFLAEGGVVSGTVVRGGDSTAVKYEEVRIYDLSGIFIASDWTDGSGYYEVTGLSPADYYVYTWVGGGLVNQYYDGAYDTASATPVTVTPGDTLTGIDFMLYEPGYMAGYVTSDTSGNTEGISNVTVYLYAVGDTSMQYMQQSTDGNGFYVFDNVDPGAYFIRTDEMMNYYVDEYYNDASGFAAADTVWQSAPGDTAWVGTIGLDIPRGGIVGTVLRSADSSPIESVAVMLYRANDPTEDGPYLSEFTDASGSYAFNGIPSGVDYDVFISASHLNFTDSWYDGSFSRSGAHLQHVTEGVIDTLTSYIDSGAVVSGSVYASLDSAAIESAMVVLLLASDSSTYAETMTDASGAYSFRGVPGTGFLLACYAGYLGYGTTWWDGHSSLDSADVLGVIPQTDTSDNNFYLDAAGSISGRVMSARDSAGIGGAKVEVYNEFGTWVMDMNADNDGLYSVDGLTPGIYFVVVQGGNGYFTQWWSGQDGFATADTVELVNAADTAGFDFYLVPGATVSGNLLRSADGEQISTGIGLRLISVERADTSTMSNWMDHYEFTDLAAGSYWIEYYTSYYLDAATDTFTLVAGDDLTRDLGLQPRLVINEIHYNGGSAQYATATNPEFVELYVLDDVDLNNWSVNDRNMNNWWVGQSMPAIAGDYAVFHMCDGNDTTIGTVHHLYFSTKDGLGDGGGYVGLNAPDGNAADLVVYEGGPGWSMANSDNFVGWPNDGNNPTDPGASSSGTNRSVSLMPDGVDNNSGNDWHETFVTEGTANELPVFFEELVADTGTFSFDGIGAVLMFIDSLGGSDTVAVSVFLDSLPPNLPGGNPIARFYQISAGAGLTGFTTVVTFSYTQAEFEASDITDETQIYAARWDGGAWVPYGSTVDTANNTVTFTTNQFSLWSLGGPGGSVPVELSSFTAQENGGAVELAWTTASEEANLGWDVYRSIDGGAFDKINGQMVAGAGFSAMPLSYGFADNTVPAGAGEVRYYLLQTDATGGTGQSPTVTVSLCTNGIGIGEAGPGVPVFLNGNPVRGIMQLAFRTTSDGPVNVTVYDMAGRIAAVLADGRKPAGMHTVSWNTAARSVTEGMHYVRVTVGGQSATAAVTVIK